MQNGLKMFARNVGHARNRPVHTDVLGPPLGGPSDDHYDQRAHSHKGCEDGIMGVREMRPCMGDKGVIGGESMLLIEAGIMYRWTCDVTRVDV